MGGLSYLDEVELHALDVHLQAQLYLTVQEVVAYVEKRFGVAYTLSGMMDCLKRLGFVYKKPKVVPGKADPLAQSRSVLFNCTHTRKCRFVGLIGIAVDLNALPKVRVLAGVLVVECGVHWMVAYCIHVVATGCCEVHTQGAYELRTGFSGILWFKCLGISDTGMYNTVPDIDLGISPSPGEWSFRRCIATEDEQER
jgi:hypothetical protein